MKLDAKQLEFLGLSRTELKVLDAVWAGQDTPLLIARYTKVSRPAVYEILDRFKKRGLAKTNIRDGKHYWSPAKARDLEEVLYNTKKALLSIEEGVEEVYGVSDATVIVHRGGEAVRACLSSLVRDHKRERLYGIQGDIVAIGWNKVFGVEGTNEINRLIKKNELIVEALLPQGWFERQVSLMGTGWAKDFSGRMSVTHEIDPAYFDHGGQLWIFKHSLYLIAMHEEIIIEVRNSEIQKLVLGMFRFMQDHSKKIDVNAVLRELIVRSGS
jgi:hypothetical protein